MLSGKNIWRLVAAFAFLTLGGGLAAQSWYLGTGYIYYPAVNASGNVGIGPGFSTVAPVETVDVKGTAHVSGKVGIGTTANPTNMLHVYSTAVADGLAIDGPSSPAIVFGHAGDAKGYIGFSTQQGNYFDGAAANDLIIRSEVSTSSIHIGRCCAAPTLTVSGPNVGIGVVPSANDAKFHVAGDMLVGTNLNVVGTITGGVVHATFTDVAEWVPSGGRLAPGTVVIIDRGKKNEVIPSSHAYDTSVAGVVSQQPGLLLGVESDAKSQIATTGRVRVHSDATGHPIAAGDLLVTSGKSGTAMYSEPVDLGGIKIHRPGTILGKALEPLPGGEGDTLVLLSLQ